MPIKYVVGDATSVPDGTAIIAHVCNDKGGWGKGFVRSISAKWPEPEQRYRKWYQSGYEPDSGKFGLGRTQFVSWESAGKIWVANMIAQSGYAHGGRVAVDYPSLENCLKEVAYEAKEGKLRIQMPRIGTGLGGGSWEKVEPIILATCADVEVHVFDLT